MAQHYPEIIGVSLLLIFLATMTYHGIMIHKGLRGYRHHAREEHESEKMRRRIEDLMNEKIHDR